MLVVLVIILLDIFFAKSYRTLGFQACLDSD